MDADLFNLKKELDSREAETLSDKAILSSSGLRRYSSKLAHEDHRQNFAIDVDRILHSLVYTRYIDKTQVFYLIRHDHISHRVLHVQLVSRIARTVGLYLGLNLDLIEAIALGHDLGHAPFGHDGETYLSELCLAHGVGHFVHSVQSVEFLENIERHGLGLNLCIQVLDGILAHDGELDIGQLSAGPAISFDELENRMVEKVRDPSHDFKPSTYEGCVVRLADSVSYVGRDIEDAIVLGIIDRSELPKECTDVLGNTNGQIVYNLVTDLIKTSRIKDIVGFSPEKSEVLVKLKNFNRERIYYNQEIKNQKEKIKNLYTLIFEQLISDLKSDGKESPIFAGFLKGMDQAYLDQREPGRIVRDFIAGMTDDYFLNLGQHLLIPQHHDPRFS